jgi:hypothetical protein
MIVKSIGAVLLDRNVCTVWAGVGGEGGPYVILGRIEQILIDCGHEHLIHGLRAGNRVQIGNIPDYSSGIELIMLRELQWVLLVWLNTGIGNYGSGLSRLYGEVCSYLRHFDPLNYVEEVTLIPVDIELLNTAVIL